MAFRWGKTRIERPGNLPPAARSEHRSAAPTIGVETQSEAAECKQRVGGRLGNNIELRDLAADVAGAEVRRLRGGAEENGQGDAVAGLVLRLGHVFGAVVDRAAARHGEVIVDRRTADGAEEIRRLVGEESALDDFVRAAGVKRAAAEIDVDDAGSAERLAERRGAGDTDEVVHAGQRIVEDRREPGELEVEIRSAGGIDLRCGENAGAVAGIDGAGTTEHTCGAVAAELRPGRNRDGRTGGKRGTDQTQLALAHRGGARVAMRSAEGECSCAGLGDSATRAGDRSTRVGTRTRCDSCGKAIVAQADRPTRAGECADRVIAPHAVGAAVDRDRGRIAENIG